MSKSRTNGSYRHRGWLRGSPHPSTPLPPQTPNVIVELHVVVQARGGVSVALSQGGHLRWGDVRGTRETLVELGGGGGRKEHYDTTPTCEQTKSQIESAKIIHGVDIQSFFVSDSS